MKRAESQRKSLKSLKIDIKLTKNTLHIIFYFFFFETRNIFRFFYNKQWNSVFISFLGHFSVNHPHDFPLNEWKKKLSFLLNVMKKKKTMRKKRQEKKKPEKRNWKFWTDKRKLWPVIQSFKLYQFASHSPVGLTVINRNGFAFEMLTAALRLDTSVCKLYTTLSFVLCLCCRNSSFSTNTKRRKILVRNRTWLHLSLFV